MKPRKKNFIFPLLIFVFLSSAQLDRVMAAAFYATQWSTPQRIPGLEDIDVFLQPVFVTEPNGNLHVFNSQFTNGLSIVYSNWILGVGWTNPVDVVVSPREETRLAGAALDHSKMDLIFWGGGEVTSANIYYTYAPLSALADSKAWAEPLLIGPGADYPNSAVMASDGNGFLGVFYSGDFDSNGLYSVQSIDGGKTWSDAAPLYLSMSDNLGIYNIHSILSSDGDVHLVWSVVDLQTALGVAIYYCKYDRETKTCPQQQVLAKVIRYEAGGPNIIEYEDQLIVVYNNDEPTTRFMRRSLDDGKTWTDPVRLFNQVGSNGIASMLIDSGGNLHLFFGNRLTGSFGSPDIHGVWHSIWQGEQWSVPEAVISGPLVQVGPNGEEGFDPSMVQSIVIHGNLLFVIWRQDPQAGPIHIWFTYRLLDTPNTTPKITPTIESTPTQSSLVGEIPTSTQIIQTTPTIVDTPPDNGETWQSRALLSSIVVSMTVVILIIVLADRKKRPRY
jgi:hypothetical protein